MTDELENETPTNNEGENQPDDSNESESNVETVEKSAYENQKVRAEKAEAELKKLKAEANANKQKEPQAPNNPTEPDYNDRLDKLTLKAEGITHSDDQALVIKEAKRLKMSVEDVVKEDYMKSRLKTLAGQREAEAGMPDSSGKGSGGAQNSVDYWIDKKNPKNPEEYMLPKDSKLAIEVINARIARDKNKQEFPDYDD